MADGRFRDSVADLAAPLHYQAKDELVGEDVRQHRRTLRIIYTVITVLTLLALLTSTAAVVAIQQRQAALLQLNIATSRQLAADADLQASDNPQLAALLSVAAFKIQDTPEAQTSLLHQLDRLQHIDRFLQSEWKYTVSLSRSRF